MSGWAAWLLQEHRSDLTLFLRINLSARKLAVAAESSKLLRGTRAPTADRTSQRSLKQWKAARLAVVDNRFGKL
jgi:hypothetical protein